LLKVLRILLFPISILYGAIILLRNFLYDCGIFKSSYGAIPTIVVGNLSLGGTGKTPHTEYLIERLKGQFNLAFLSRGYGRQTKGFILIDKSAKAHQVGDEPLQISKKYPEIISAVCENRLEGIAKIKNRFPNIELTILDDAYQHRSLKPHISLLLTEFHQPFWQDYMLPTGHLRDNVSAIKRAHYIIITKCPEHLSDAETAAIKAKLSLSNNQKIFFTTLAYGNPVLISGPAIKLEHNARIVGFAGIANTKNFKQHLANHYKIDAFLDFADHHIFSQTDLNTLQQECNTFAHPTKIWVTTEKDAMRLMDMDLPKDISIFYIPIKIKFLKESEDSFIQELTTQLSALQNTA
jgi:tetraacyldisaccharide 4'-kinase